MPGVIKNTNDIELRTNELSPRLKTSFVGVALVVELPQTMSPACQKRVNIRKIRGEKPRTAIIGYGDHLAEEESDEMVSGTGQLGKLRELPASRGQTGGRRGDKIPEQATWVTFKYTDTHPYLGKMYSKSTTVVWILDWLKI